jgi:hypothetical protein
MFFGIFSLIAKFTCSKFDTNQKCFCMFKVVDSNALGEEEAFEVDYASRLFNFHVLKDFFNPC